ESEIYAYFLLCYFECDPEEITKIVGVSPTDVWRIGDKITNRSTLKRKKNGWRLKSNLEQTADLDAHIRNVLERLKPGWEKLRELGLQYYAEISCVIYNYEAQVPVMHFDKEIIKAAAELNAEIDIDYYSLYEPE
ncbi:MAG TPA: DUF4279 domain-containing protein, partial [Nostocaceae cyanobacterium]|nr:DUF4279 domain-containing protein [Nostocaceae cyanobacterium]